MPIVTIKGIPKAFHDTPMYRNGVRAIREGVVSIRELELKTDDVSIFVQSDMPEGGFGEEIIVEVSRLFRKKNRTKVVRQKLADKIAAVVTDSMMRFLENCQRVEVFIDRPFDPEKDGFATNKRPNFNL